jgi:hypothetical protein
MAYGNRQLEWRGSALCRVGSRTPVVTIVPDAKYPGMWRVRRPDGSLSDMVNLTRARDAARGIALTVIDMRTALAAVVREAAE